MRLSQLSLKDLRTQLSTEKPDIVGFSVLTFNLLNCLEVCKIVKTATPHTKICFGGWHPTLYPHETVNLAPVDFVVVGEGETTCVELVNILSKHPHSYKDYLHTIYGLGYKNQHGQCVINPNRALIQNLDAIPFPAYELINLKNYTNLLACTNNIANIITTRGCPYACSFCDIRRSRYRTRSPQNVLQEIKFLVDKGITEFFLQDDNFTLDRKRTIKFCQLLIEEKLNIQYKISSRVNHIDNEIASYLKKSGCYRIYFGVESGSQEVLNYLEKGITLEQIKNAFYFAHKHKS